MRPSLIGRYVFKEIATAFLFCFAVFLFTGMIAGFLPLLQKGMEAGLALTIVLFQVLINALPSTLVTVLPLSIAIGILLGLGRMSTDNEIMALKASGVPIVKLLPPVLVVGIIGVLLCLCCTLVLIPSGIAKGRKLMHEALATRFDAGLEERNFFDALKDLIIYVDKIDSDRGVMTNVFIRESSQPDEIKTIIARKGRMAPDPEGKALILDLREGTVLTEDRNGDSTGPLAFQSLVFRHQVRDVGVETAQKTLEESSLIEITERVRAAEEKEKVSTGPEKEFYQRITKLGRLIIAQRFTYPFACLALALMAFPIGVITMGRSRLNNVSVGLVAIFAYYALTLTAERIARSMSAGPELIMSLPPVIFIALAAYFIRCVRLEITPLPILVLQKGIQALRRQ